MCVDDFQGRLRPRDRVRGRNAAKVAQAHREGSRQPLHPGRQSVHGIVLAKGRCFVNARVHAQHLNINQNICRCFLPCFSPPPHPVSWPQLASSKNAPWPAKSLSTGARSSKGGHRTRMLDGLMSPWSTSCACKWSTPRSNCHNMNWYSSARNPPTSL